LRSRKNEASGGKLAMGLLLVFVILFVGGVIYLLSPSPGNASTTKTYFEGLNFTLAPQKIWHVGVPITNEGDLQLSFTSNSSVRVYERYSQGYLLDQVVQGNQQFTTHVVPKMDIVEVTILNLLNSTVGVTGATCALTP